MRFFKKVVREIGRLAHQGEKYLIRPALQEVERIGHQAVKHVISPAVQEVGRIAHQGEKYLIRPAVQEVARIAHQAEKHVFRPPAQAVEKFVAENPGIGKAAAIILVAVFWELTPLIVGVAVAGGSGVDAAVQHSYKRRLRKEEEKKIDAKAKAIDDNIRKQEQITLQQLANAEKEAKQDIAALGELEELINGIHRNCQNGNNLQQVPYILQRLSDDVLKSLGTSYLDFFKDSKEPESQQYDAEINQLTEYMNAELLRRMPEPEQQTSSAPRP